MVKLCSFSGILGHNYVRKKCWCQNKRNIKCIHASENFTDVCVGSWVQTLIPHGNSGWAGPLDLSSPAPGVHGSLYGWDCSGPFCSAAFVCEFPVVPVLLPQHCNDIMGNFFFLPSSKNFHCCYHIVRSAFTCCWTLKAWGLYWEGFLRLVAGAWLGCNF